MKAAVMEGIRQPLVVRDVPDPRPPDNGVVLRVDEKLAFAKELGAVATVNASDGQAAGAIVELTKGGAHVSVDALGIAATCRSSSRCATVGVTVIDRYDA